MALANGGEVMEVEGAIHSEAGQIRDDEMRQPVDLDLPTSNTEGFSTPRSSKSLRLGRDSSPRSGTRGSVQLIKAELTGQRELTSAADGQGMEDQSMSMTAVEHPSEIVESERAGSADVEERGRPRKTPNSPARGGDVEFEMRSRELDERRNEETLRVYAKFQEGAGKCMCLVRGKSCPNPGTENLVAEGSISSSSNGPVVTFPGAGLYCAYHALIAVQGIASQALQGPKISSDRVAMIALRSEQDERSKRVTAQRERRLMDEAQAAEKSVNRLSKESSRARQEANDALQAQSLTALSADAIIQSEMGTLRSEAMKRIETVESEAEHLLTVNLEMTQASVREALATEEVRLRGLAEQVVVNAEVENKHIRSEAFTYVNAEQQRASVLIREAEQSKLESDRRADEAEQALERSNRRKHG